MLRLEKASVRLLFPPVTSIRERSNITNFTSPLCVSLFGSEDAAEVNSACFQARSLEGGEGKWLPRRRLKTGGAGELWVLGISIALLCLGIYLANGGGITQKVSQNLGLRDGIVRIYNENASTNKVYASITGYWTSDRTPADGKYLIIGNEGKEFIVSNGKGVYKTGEQIITSKVTTEVGEAARTEIRNITFNDEDAVSALLSAFGIAPLEELQNAYPGADIYLTGELSIDFPEDVLIPIEPNQMTTATLSGSSLKLAYE